MTVVRKSSLNFFIFRIRRSSRLHFFAIALLLIFAVNCTPWDLEKVSFLQVVTGPAEINPILPKVRLQGEIRGLLEQEIVDNYGHVWSETADLSLDNNHGISLFGKKRGGEFQSELQDLTPGRTYYYTAYAQYQEEVKYGEIASFMVPTFSPQLVIDSIREISTLNSPLRTIHSTISGLVAGIRLQSYGFTWGESPQPVIESNPFTSEQRILISEQEFHFESQVILKTGLNHIRPYLVVGDTIFYGEAKIALIENVWIPKANFGGGDVECAVGFSIGNKGYIGTGRNESGRKEDFWEYDPQADLWTQRANFGGGKRYDAVGFSIGNKGYIGTGWGENGISHDFWEYDPQTNLWSQHANVGGGGRRNAVGFSIGNKGYIGTGQDEDRS